MCAFLPSNTERNVIPRWRDFNQTQLLGELKNTAAVKVSNRFDEVSLLQHRSKIGTWNEIKNIENAVELINSAYILDDFENAKEAAGFLLDNYNRIPSSLKLISNRIVTAEEVLLVSESENKEFSELNQLISGLIRDLRKKLNLNPYNAINWIEIARLYLIIGKEKEAERCILVSLQLSPNNRYVARVSSRFFVHTEDFVKAKKILKDNVNFKNDPWLLGADIAISTLQHKSSFNIKKGFELIDSGKFSAFDSNELTSALATEEFHSGKRKNSIKLFNQSLIQPNDNSVAQAVWASTQISIPSLQNSIIARVPNIFEAKAYNFYQNKNWDQTLSSTLEWFLDQPFSRDPAIFGSFIASATLEKYDTAIELCLFGLRATPNEFYLLNNLAFSYLMINQIKNAGDTINKIHAFSLNDRQRTIYLATKGLFEYANKHIEEGNRYYLEATALADKLKDSKLKITAEFYHLRAKLLFDAKTETTLPLLDKLEAELRKLEVPYLLTILNNLRNRTR